jgi:hypothetical protein
MWWAGMAQVEEEEEAARVVAVVREGHREPAGPTWWAWSLWARRPSLCASRSLRATAETAAPAARVAQAVREGAGVTSAPLNSTDALVGAVATEARAVSVVWEAQAVAVCRSEQHAQRASRCEVAAS